ncbi:unnamed protein product [Amoebophrya sp. A25]|nr:unnamed protein product [Amoebophrya sp. A25]|eukprot:GSA25T00019825001.1
MSKFLKLAVAGFAGVGVARETRYLRNGHRHKVQEEGNEEKASEKMNCAVMFNKFDRKNQGWGEFLRGRDKQKDSGATLAYKAVCGSGLDAKLYSDKPALKEWVQKTYGDIDVEKPSKDTQYQVPMKEVEKGAYDATKNSFYQCCNNGCSSSSCR